jgi:hypothetical protein
VRPTCGAWPEPHQAASGRCPEAGDCPGGMTGAATMVGQPVKGRTWSRWGQCGMAAWRDQAPEFPDKL